MDLIDRNNRALQRNTPSTNKNQYLEDLLKIPKVEPVNLVQEKNSANYSCINRIPFEMNHRDTKLLNLLNKHKATYNSNQNKKDKKGKNSLF